MNIFDQYGIKEVADVTIYSIHRREDGSGDVYYLPALYLDTLKVTTTEKTADNTWAQGGLGNSRLISWDYGKQINLTLEDALCTPASLGLCWGGVLGADWKDARVNHEVGIKGDDCGIERISRMEKAFYPRNDGENGTVSALLPRDGKEDIAEDWNGEPSYLTRSSVLDGTVVKGFGYVNSHPYKWHLEIETAVKSVAVVPDRFYSTLGKGYPIKKRQTVGINQPSNSFKYEIIYRRGYDNYPTQAPSAKIIYHKQAENSAESIRTCWDKLEAIAMLDDMEKYPFLKIRVCYDNSIRAYLGTENVDWDLERQIEDTTAAADNEWVENPYVDTEQFRHIEMWQRFDSINALSYYLITKYEENILSIGPKDVLPGVPKTAHDTKYFKVPATTLHITIPRGVTASTNIYVSNVLKETSRTVPQECAVDVKISAIDKIIAKNSVQALYYAFLNAYSVVTIEDGVVTYTESGDNIEVSNGTIKYEIGAMDIDQDEIIIKPESNVTVVTESKESGEVADVVGLDYNLVDSDLSVDTNGTCTPCCKKGNLSRAIWAYINPRTMTPYDDDYWFHQGEPFYKKSLTLSTKEHKLSAKKITVTAGDFPGMYKIVGETYIRQRETGEDERVQITFPLCKIKSDQTLTLEADGDPTTFNMDVEVAVPPNGVSMEITFYDVEKDMKQNCGGSMVEKDGSTKVSAK